MTRRELEALCLTALGFGHEAADRELGVRTSTLKNHLYNVIRKLGANNRVDAVVRAVQHRIMTVSSERPLVDRKVNEYCCAVLQC